MTNILISGASIAGTTLAYWLREYGFTPTVVERANEVREGGYKVDIRGAALDVVERMGLLEHIRSLRTDVRTGSVVDGAGRQVASMDGDSFGGRVHQDAELHRGDLTRLLHEATSGVEYLFGDSIASIDGTQVTFDSGLVRHFDLVVGADGLHSNTRALAFGPEDRYVRDMGYNVSIFSVPNHLGLDREELTYVGPGRTALLYSTRQDAGAKAMFLWQSDDKARERAEQQRILAEAYTGSGWEVPRLLEGMADAPDFYYDSLSQVRMDSWHAGRVALIGDAAYCASPASGQGTSLALVGAYVLAGELKRAAGDHTAAFPAYEARMRPFVEANQALGTGNIKRMVMATPFQVRMSMIMLRVVNLLPGKDRIMAKVVEPIHRAATAIDLPSY
ncbi:FAD-dependent monooxygenase [Nonomuraea soli]|uniref:2-polyprenyl-6-methoxyphenol hydroxylase-like FAD-dependent oxidoreductase n=1 Tax=Nonomuraea soli TaxID=1032476 RepID=A0A7W0CQT8_9ACTN|nr:FAD-dependent monooxygenase [Nonomuraea soli]MBA2895499.1 2-polyprenyl-6-methoxyphenol hydroxylase-like FAD-dependent oxidoreductase [Nonomuraea soli]